MDPNDVQTAIERNASSILITMFVVVDTFITIMIIRHTAQLSSTPFDRSFPFVQSFDYQLLRTLLVCKSVVLYMGIIVSHRFAPPHAG